MYLLREIYEKEGKLHLNFIYTLNSNRWSKIDDDAQVPTSVICQRQEKKGERERAPFTHCPVPFLPFIYPFTVVDVAI